MSYSRRVGVWLLALSVRFLQACLHMLGHKLEMISVWLLFLKLLRATAGVKRPNGNEINEGRKDSLNQQEKEQEYLSEAVAMETSQHSEMADLTDCKMDLGDTEEEKYQCTEDEGERCDAYFSESLDTVKSSSPITEEFKSDEEAERSSTLQEEEDVMVEETEIEESDVQESAPSPEPDQASDLLMEEEYESPIAFDAEGIESQEPQESPKVEEESALEQQINEFAISDASTESCHDNDEDNLSDCLQVEMAIVSSDSDVEEQWKAMFSPVVDTEEMGDALEPDTHDVDEETNTQDHPTEEDGNTLSESNLEPEDETPSLTTESTDVLEQPECQTECELEDVPYEAAIHYSSLTKIPEDEEELGQKHTLQRLSASTSELDKRLPPDYCIIQEMKSEDISTEHVDFRSARQQWQKMEEQNKGWMQQCAFRQGKSQGSHNFMYTPVRNLERAKKDPESDGLGLGDYQYIQFSPCSEDSGLDDTSYRSPYDEPETPVEREIRETMEREEIFRQERAMSRPSSAELGPGKTRPATLLTGKSDGEDRKRMFNTPEDRCRSQRSPSDKTPTFSITASPSPRPGYHEMVANNVIILEPDSYLTSPRHRGKSLLSPGTNRVQELPADMSNIIVLETSNLIIRSASEFCLSTACQESQESTFHNNPFFKLRSHSTQSLVDQEIKVVRQRDEEFRRQRAQLYAKEKYDTVLVSPSLLETFTFDRPGQIPAKCKSSPSSPSKARKMDRSVLSCDQKFPEAPYPRVRRKSALAQRWEAGIFANHQQD